MKEKKIIKNYLYNVTYQIMNILVPIITIPYVSRIFGAELIGASSYTQSVVLFFVTISMFGIVNYGSKNIAFSRNNKKKLSNEFWGIWFLQAITSLLGIIIYVIFFVFLDILNMKNLFIMQLPWLLATLIDISWFYVGIEDFKKTSTRNILVKIIGLLLIFILVKKKNHLWIFVLINSMSAFIGNIIFWLYLKRYIERPIIKDLNVTSKISGAFILLLPQIAVQIYTTLDRVVIGSMSNMTQVGYYDQSQKISRIMLMVVTSLGIVLMPRIANMYANKDYKNINKYLRTSLHFTVAASIFITASIMVVSKHFVPIFFGEDYKVIIPYMMISSLIIIFISVGGVFSNQFTLPTGKNKEYVIPLFLAAIINLVLNIMFVPKLGALGGVISIVVTELCVLILRIVLVRKYLNLKLLFKGTLVYLIAGVISFSSTYLISCYLEVSIIAVLIEGVMSTLVFGVILFKFDNLIKDNILSILKH